MLVFINYLRRLTFPQLATLENARNLCGRRQRGWWRPGISVFDRVRVGVAVDTRMICRIHSRRGIIGQYFRRVDGVVVNSSRYCWNRFFIGSGCSCCGYCVSGFAHDSAFGYCGHGDGFDHISLADHWRHAEQRLYGHMFCDYESSSSLCAHV